MNFQLMNDTKIDCDREVVKRLYTKPKIILISCQDTEGKAFMRTPELMFGNYNSMYFGPS